MCKARGFCFYCSNQSVLDLHSTKIFRFQFLAVFFRCNILVTMCFTSSLLCKNSFCFCQKLIISVLIQAVCSTLLPRLDVYSLYVTKRFEIRGNKLVFLVRYYMQNKILSLWLFCKIILADLLNLRVWKTINSTSSIKWTSILILDCTASISDLTSLSDNTSVISAR